MTRSEVFIKILAIFFALVGFSLIIFAVYPILSYEVVSRQKYPELLSPIVENKSLGVSISNSRDYTLASNWFDDSSESNDFISSSISHYTISIPDLGIKNATVSIGGEDLSESLIHYPGTSFPGKMGNSVIFGHSILPQFFNPSDYLSIFSTLPTLREGEEIEVVYDGVTYLYKVEDMFEVGPNDIQILEQDKGDSFLTLVTCIPPGHPLRPKRLIVRARIVPFGSLSQS
jgi:sortase A